MFQPVSFTPPPSIDALAQGLAPTLQAVQGAFTQGAGALSGLGLPPSGSGALAAIMGKARGEATGALGSSAKYLALTPYQHGIGTRKGEHAYLTPADALKGICGRLGEADASLMDRLVEGEMPQNGLVLVLFAAPTPGGLASSLQEFTSVYPIKELEQAMRRARGLERLETEKFLIPKAPAYPAWGEACPQKNPTGQGVAKSLGALLAKAEGMAAGAVAPAERLGSFAAKQAQKATAQASALQSIAAKMQGAGAGWFGIYLEGAGAEIARLLAKAPVPLDEAYKCTAALCWYGSKSDVAYYKEAFGLRNPLEGILP